MWEQIAMTNNIINQADPGIVVKESVIHLSDEELNNVLLRTYERAQQDAQAVKFHKFYGVFLSIAGTLFLTLLTSDFRNLGSIKAEAVNEIAWIVFSLSAVIGIVLLIVNFRKQAKNNTIERDKAVEEILQQYIRINQTLSSQQVGSLKNTSSVQAFERQ